MNKNRNILIVFLSLLTLIACNNQNKVSNSITKTYPTDIANTKWIFELAEDCSNYYQFGANNRFNFESCEVLNEYYGYYTQNNDTLTLIEEGILIVGDTINEPIYKMKYISIIEETRLYHVEVFHWFNNKWEKRTNLQFDLFNPDYYYLVNY